MRRWILAMALFLPVAAFGANTLAWVDAQGGSCSLSGETCYLNATSSTTDESRFLDVRNREVSMLLELDTDGGNTAAVFTVYVCAPNATGVLATTGCREAELFDTDADGIPDDGTFQTGVGRLGVQGVNLAGWIYVDVVTPPGSGTARFSVSVVRRDR